ncbi:flap endonuclease GEN homolog 1 [Engraulis encrasicolus]|uniref:flap endonuclease GEN homolog 1 n=1 Tax=Engraulis encrasicolus TaxID=184585 RepID=UPI002FD62B8A
MGVHELWSILEPVRESVSLYSLTGKTLAVDLSLWVCEAQHVQAMMGKVHKPHLRNLFFRVSSLLLMGVKLLFVMEGEPPKLKAETMSKRTEMRFGGFQKKAPKAKPAKNTGRGRFNAVLRECAAMLDCLGVPWVTAAGEAEAMCAFLDLHGFVDGCITNDGDAFLYGARTVYRNFNMNTKDPQVECYKMSRVEEDLHLSRETLVGMAVFLGCDYIPKGVPGVGKEMVLKLIHSLKGQSLLQKFTEWKNAGAPEQEKVVKKVPHCPVCRHPGSEKAHERNGCVWCGSAHFCQPQDYDLQCPCDWHCSERLRQANATETTVRKKTLACESFPFTEIIDEFLVSKDKPIEPLRRRKPNLLSMQNYAFDKMEWPKEYTSEKLLPLMTYTELVNKQHGRDTVVQMQPIRIYKPRVRNGISCFEVIWKKPAHYVFPEEQEVERHEEEEVVRTVEEEALFRLAYPLIAELYAKEREEAHTNKLKKKKPKNKKEKSTDMACKDDDDVSDLLSRMTLKKHSAEKPTSATTTTATAVAATIQSGEKLPRDEILPDMSAAVGERDGDENEVNIQPGEEKPNKVEVVEVEKPLPQSPLPGPSASQALQATTPLSTSTVMDKLHLSDIDWEACSFTASSPSQAPGAGTSPQASVALDGSVLTLGDRSPVIPVIKSRNRTESEPLAETELCSLRERVLMRNAAVRSISASEPPAVTTTGRSEVKSAPVEGEDSAVINAKFDTGRSRHEKELLSVVEPQSQPLSKTLHKNPQPLMMNESQKPVKGPSGPMVQSGKFQPLRNVAQEPVNSLESRISSQVVSKTAVVTISTATNKAKQPNLESANPPVKYKFVKTSKAYAPALLQQQAEAEDPSSPTLPRDAEPDLDPAPAPIRQTQNPDPAPEPRPRPNPKPVPELNPNPKVNPKPRKPSKPSVCVGLVYSSDDSDVENQPRGQRSVSKASKAKFKPRPKSVYPNAIYPKGQKAFPAVASRRAVGAGTQPKQTPPQPPLPTTATLLMPITTATTLAVPRSDAAVGLSPRLPECLPQRTERAEATEVIDLCLSAPSSPSTSAAPSEIDDSVVSIESPLPLAERLKLKFAK